MIEDLLKLLDTYRSKISDYVDIGIIEKKQKELNVEFPQSMTEFYIHFGNDEDVLSSFYVFDKIEDVRIENEAITFGEKHQNIGRLGIKLEDLNTKSQTVCWYPYDLKKWYVEESVSRIFFFGIACWQVLNTMPSIAKVHISRENFEKVIGNGLKYLSEDKLLLLGDVIPVLGNGILGCYLVSDEELYLGTIIGDEVLEKYDQIFDLDWL